MQKEWREVLRSKQAVLDRLGWQDLDLLVEWPQGDPGAHAARLKRLFLNPYVSHVYLDPTLSGGELRFRLDGLVLPGPPFTLQQYEALCRAARDAPEAPEEDAKQPATPTEPEPVILRVRALETVHGTQVTLSRTRPWGYKPAWTWPNAAGKALDQMRRHPNGLILFAEHGTISGTRASGRVFQQIVLDLEGEARTAWVSDQPPGWNLPDSVTQLRVEGSEDSWRRALSGLMQQDVDCVGIAGFDGDVAMRQAILASLQDRFVLADSSHFCAAEALRWVFHRVGVDPAQVAQVLVGVVAVYPYLRRVCSSCAAARELEVSLQELFANQGVTPLRAAKWKRAVGCPQCNRTGYALGPDRWLPVVEAVYVDRELARSLAQSLSLAQIESLLRERGIRSFLEQAVGYASDGLTTPEEALRVGLARRADL